MRNIIFGAVIVLTVSFAAAFGSTPYPFEHAPGTNRIVTFWATWCAACKMELKEFETELPKLPGITLVLINLDSKPEAAKEWLNKNFKLEHIFVSDPDYKLADQVKLTAFPTTFLVNKDNKIVYELRNFEADKSTKILMDKAKELLL